MYPKFLENPQTLYLMPARGLDVHWCLSQILSLFDCLFCVFFYPLWTSPLSHLPPPARCWFLQQVLDPAYVTQVMSNWKSPSPLLLSGDDTHRCAPPSEHHSRSFNWGTWRDGAPEKVRSSRLKALKELELPREAGRIGRQMK